MKRIALVLMLALVATISVDAHRNIYHRAPVSIQLFFNELEPYGDWLYTPEYGYVWRPYFDRPESFRPYSSNGDWVYTEYGWTWISDYPWGWAPFHYGRWYFDDYLGWMWIPGYEWAPAWVAWGSFNDNWGWAPLGPGIYVNINFNWAAPDFWWTFVPCHWFHSSGWRHHIYDRPVHVTNITYINNIYINNNDRGHDNWFRGPRVNDVERHSGNRVRQMQIVQSERPDSRRIDNSRVSLYNPRINERNEGVRPQNFRNVENVRPAGQMKRQTARDYDPGENRVATERRVSRPENTPAQNTRKNTNPSNDDKIRKSNSRGDNRDVDNRTISKPDNERRQQNPSINRNSSNSEKKESSGNTSVSRNKNKESGSSINRSREEKKQDVTKKRDNTSEKKNSRDDKASPAKSSRNRR